MIQRRGASLTGHKGFAPSKVVGSRARLSRVLAIGLPLAAVIAGTAGILAGLGEPTLTGISLEPPGGHVQSVDPGSFAWASGIRPGQLVVALSDALQAGGWSVFTAAGATEYGLTERAVIATMRLGLVPAVLAASLGLVAIVMAKRHRRRAESLGVVAIFIAWIPLAASHNQLAGALVGSLATVVGGVWLVRWSGPAIVAMAVVAISVALDLTWTASRAVGLPESVEVDALRFAWSAIVAVGVAAIGLGVTPRAITRRTSAIRYVDVAAVTALVAAVAALEIAARPPLWTAVLLVAVAIVAYRPIRARVRSWIDRVIFAEERERAAIASAESERARLSRELHDEPLQALVGVILRLEEQPGVGAERETLRAVAGQLRNIATSLHPPVLDDLGLVPAVESLFAEPGPIPIELLLRSSTGYRSADRPPFEVELATYRIIQEAATNAIRHSGCHRIVVRGEVSRTMVSIDVVDDGHGVHERELDEALRGGHIGVASMRRRAEAIDARLVHLPAPTAGTIVSLRWSE
jgi:signal transduction histidine kinase